MRSARPLVFTGLTFLLAGCSASVRGSAKDGSSNVSADFAESGDASPSGGGDGAKAAASGDDRKLPALPPPSGPPTATYPGFDVLPDGQSVVTVQVRGPVTVTEQKAEGRLIYFLSGVNVPERVNRLPLLTQHFPTQVSSVTLEQATGGATLIIDLREPSTGTQKISPVEGGSLITITLPRSERWSQIGTNNPRGEGNPDPSLDEAGFSATDREATEAGSADVPEDADKETQRRKKQSKRQPINYVDRTITLPYQTLSPDVDVSVAGVEDTDPFATLSGSIKYGIIDELEIEVNPLTFRVQPNPAYVFPSLGMTLAYVGHPFEIGGRVRYFFGLDTERLDQFGAGTLMVGAPMAIHFDHWGRIDTGAFLSLGFGGAHGTVGGDLAVGLYEAQASPFYVDTGIPFKFLFQPVEALWIGPHTGLAIYDFNNVSETLAIPLGGEIGITASDDYNPNADLGFRLDFPQLIKPGADDKFVEKAYELGFWFRWYHHL